jgi:hypothetical protein
MPLMMINITITMMMLMVVNGISERSMFASAMAHHAFRGSLRLGWSRTMNRPLPIDAVSAQIIRLTMPGAVNGRRSSLFRLASTG